MSGGYQPLASYGAQSDVTIQEARFDPAVDVNALIEASHIGARFIRPADGFRSLIYLHDGEAGRVLAYWRDRSALERYHRTVKTEMAAYEAAHWPESPWRTGLAELRVGTASPYLVTPRMTVDHHDIVVWDPPAAVLIREIRELRDPEPLQSIWMGAAPENTPSPLLGIGGFMFFSACDFGDGAFSAYLGFLRAEHLESFLASSIYTDYEREIQTVIDSQNARPRLYTGRILSGCVKAIA